MARPDTWMAFYGDDWLADTGHCTAAQRGAYIDLLWSAWKRKNELPHDDAQLMRLARCSPSEWRQTKPVVMAFFQKDGPVYRHKRVGEELAKATARFDAKVRAGKVGGEASGKARAKQKRSKSEADVQADAKQKGTQPQPHSLTRDTEANASVGARAPTPTKSSKGTRLASDWKPNEEHRAYARELGYTDAETDAELAEFFEYFTGPDARQPVKKSWDRAVQRWLRESSSRRFAKRTRGRQSGANRPGAGSVFAALCENLEAGDLGEPGDGTRMGRGADENRMDEGTAGTGPLGSPEAGGQVIDADHWRRVSEGAGEAEVDDEGEGGIDRGHSADASNLRGRTAEISGGRGAACPGHTEEHEPLVAGVVGIEGQAGSAHSEAQAPHGSPDFDPVADMPDWMRRTA